MSSALVNFLPNDNILDQSKFKAYGDDKLKVIQMVSFVWIRQKTLREDKKMLLTSIFFSSLNVFKRLSSGSLKVRIVLTKQKISRLVQYKNIR